MFTVIVCLDWSGNRSTLRPFASRYSVMPSTVVTRSGAAGTAGAVTGGGGGVFGFFAAHAGTANAVLSTINAWKRRIRVIGTPSLVSWHVFPNLRDCI